MSETNYDVYQLIDKRVNMNFNNHCHANMFAAGIWFLVPLARRIAGTFNYSATPDAPSPPISTNTLITTVKKKKGGRSLSLSLVISSFDTSVQTH